MAVSPSVFHPAKFNPFSHNYYNPLIPTSNRAAALHYLPPFNPTLQFIKSPLSSNSFNFPRTTVPLHRRLLTVVTASSEKSSDIITQTSRILAIITFIWKLPSFIARFFEKEQKFLDTVEEDIIQAADVVKVGAKVVEELAEGLEEAAERIEKIANTIDKDAKKVDDIMDTVKEKTKTAHDELEEVVDTLEGPMKGMEKDSAKGKIGLKGSEDLEVTKKDITNDPSIMKSPPSLEKTISHSNNSAKYLNYKPFEYPTLLWRRQSLIHSLMDSLQWPFLHVHFQSPFYFMPLHQVISRAMLMASFIFFIGTLSHTTLASSIF